MSQHGSALLVEDQADFRRLMVALLARQPDLEVVAQAGSLTEARRRGNGRVRRGGPGSRPSRRERRGLDLGSARVQPRCGRADLERKPRPSEPREKAAEAGANEIMDKLATPIELIGAIRRLGTGESTDNL